MDSGYDVGPVYDAFEARDCQPIVKLRQTTAVKRGDHKPASRWVKGGRLHPLLPRETPRWRKLYRGRASVEREFGRLKHEWSLLPLRVRGIERVQLHADLTILAKLACALSRARAVPLAA